MSLLMDNNEILACWQGWRLNPACGWINPNEPNKYKTEAKVPDYPNDEAACGSLLDTLIEKGFDVSLEHDNDGWICCYIRDIDKCYIWEDGGYHTTRREAVVAACLEVARKEMDV